MIERLAQSRALRRSVESEDLDWWVDEQLHDLRQVAQEQEQAARRASFLA
jgi:trehalose-6-phosphate synthase